MIQRIQTVYLALGAVLLGAAPFAGRLDGQAAASLEWFVPVIGLLAGLAFLVAVAAVFLYGNRKRQRSVVVIAQFLVVGIVAAGLVGRRLVAPEVEAEMEGDITGWLLLAFPAAAYVLFWLARRAIDRDIELVRSMDRIR